MDRSTFSKSLPRIPDFHSMSKGQISYRLSKEGRQETDDLRHKFLVLNSRRRDGNHDGRKLQQQDRKDLSRDTTSSAPAGFRVKDRSQRNHVVLCATHPRRNSKKTNEERARQRVKDYIAKQIYKIPTCQRPEFFIKVNIDPTPPFPYPKGTLSTASCHFNYVAPRKFLNDNYKQLLGESTTKNSESKSRQLSSSEIKRNKIIERLISANKPDDIDGETTDVFTHQPTETESSIDSSVPQTPTAKSLCALKNGKQKKGDDTTLGVNLKDDQNPLTLTGQRSKTVAFSLHHNTQGVANYSRNSSREHSVDREKSILVNHQSQRSQNNTPRRLTSADIATAHARHHFIHPEWPSEFINWARYSHPATSERFRHSFI